MSKRRAATYERVSSEEQRERETIRTQADAIRRFAEANPDAQIVGRYRDDGVSGTIPLEERPDGRRLMQDARAGLFNELWIVRADRLGRDAADMLTLWKVFKELAIKLVGISESIETYLTYGIQALFADDEREKFMARSAAGMDRAAREGRYTGGIVPVGYRVEGKRPHARLVPNDEIMWADLSEADVVRRLYGHLAIDAWSCRRIATEFNTLGIPTSYHRDGRGVRGKRTQGIWRAGHIRNIATRTVYRGVLQYGRRSKKPGREVISVPCPRLVSDDTWYAAQQTLAANRIAPKNTRRVYLLRARIVCGLCGLHFCGSAGRGAVTWYRCDGYMAERGPVEGRCQAKAIKGEYLEPVVWNDIERFLRNPGDLLDELSAESNGNGARAAALAERTTLEMALADFGTQRDRMLDLYRRGRIAPNELDAHLDRIAQEQQALERRLRALEPECTREVEEAPKQDMLDELRRRLDGGLADVQRQEIVQLLVRRITVHTKMTEDGKKEARAVVEYNFPGVVPTNTGTRASQNYSRLQRVVAL